MLVGNDGGENAQFDLEGLGVNVENVRFVLFNRWGNPIISLQGTDIEFNGTIEGKSLTTGTYYYQFLFDEGQFISIETAGFKKDVKNANCQYNGFITILNNND
jgi:gliding motility-associated-like protein